MRHEDQIRQRHFASICAVSADAAAAIFELEALVLRKFDED